MCTCEMRNYFQAAKTDSQANFHQFTPPPAQQLAKQTKSKVSIHFSFIHKAPNHNKSLSQGTSTIQSN